MATMLISGGTVVSAVGRRDADVLVDGEKIVAILAPGQAAAMGVVPDRTIDATGKYVVPGGVDVHTHMELPFGGTEASDTFETGTTAAAWGGVTTIVDFAVQNTGFSVHDQLAVWHEKAAGNCAIDYGFHQIIGGVDDESLKAMTYLVDNEGITSFKLFMAYPGVLYSDDGQILRAMQNASDSGAMIMMHAENGIAIDVLVAQSIARGDTDPKFHSLTRPAELESEATHRAIQLAKVAGNVPLYIVHMSASEALGGGRCGTARRTQRVRRNVPAVPVPHPRGSARPAGIRGSQVGVLHTAAHQARAPSGRPLEGSAHERVGRRVDRSLSVLLQGSEGARDPAKGSNFSKIPNGIGGVEHRMELIYQGVVLGEISLERWVETCCTTPARMFGLEHKGVIEPGADADILVWDPNRRTKIGINDKHHMNMDHSAYEGFEIDGKVDTVISRGAVVIENDTYVGTKGHGKFVKRGLSTYLH